MNEWLMNPILLIGVGVCIVIVITTLMMISISGKLRQHSSELLQNLQHGLEDKHRAVLADLHMGLTRQGDRLGQQLTDVSDRQRQAVADELKQTRDQLHSLRLTLSEELARQREAMLERLTQSTDSLNLKIDTRLGEISGRVNERLDEGFRKTNETFVNVMTRLATIDEAQKKIEGLTTSVVSLQDLLGDKRSRGAYGEVQLEGLVRNMLPPSAFELQATLSNGTRADCMIHLPQPTGTIAVDSKFPLENYHRMFEVDRNSVERVAIQRQFRADIKKHVDDISKKYIIPGETADGAVMFIPAEAVFSEIHAHHAELTEYAMSKRVWIVSPTTLMAVLNTARAVLKDVETRKQIHVIKDSLHKLSSEFSRFDDRMRDLAKHIRQAHEDVEKVQVTSTKISQRFAQIESVQLEAEGSVQPLTSAPGVVSIPVAVELS
jgi:DNA recombination protein RmuC